MTDDENQADVIVINTCCFIHDAKQESVDTILEMAEYKKCGQLKALIVTGCLAERYQKEIRAEMPEVDAVVGIGSNSAICAVIERLSAGPQEQFGPKTAMPLGGARVISTPPHYAYLKIAEGCNNGCYYCAIPLIRGGLRSRAMSDCVAEAKWLADQGVQELIVVAQDPTAYGEDWGKPGSICQLLDQLNAVEGIRWIRILYAYPERITDEFVAALQRNEKVLPYLDLPIQHCNDEILHRMNRRGGRREIEEAIAKLRAGIPNITLRTTLIAGFPGETEEQFEEMCRFVRDMQFDRLGCFAYSPEEGTKAATMPDQIDEEVKQRRADQIMEIQTGIMSRKQAERVGQELECICDELDEENGLYLLRTMSDAPEIDGNVCVPADEYQLEFGHFYKVHILDSDLYDLYGEIVEELV